jgi:hypothetical protein
MKLANCILTPDKLMKNREVSLKSKFLKKSSELNFQDSFAYAPFINSHDHLIGNWYPKAGDNNPYPNSDIWVEDMKKSDSYKERCIVWPVDGKFNLTNGNAYILTTLGVYKNIFAGCNVVQDHIKNQLDEYYESFPINVLKDYRQAHTLTMGNWWGGKTPCEEWRESENKMPFILHLGEGVDENAKSGFPTLVEMDLLQKNTLLIHGITLTRKQLREMASVGASVCWCPASNMFLIGKTLDLTTALEENVNVVLGTDSTLSGSNNLLEEIKLAHRIYPDLPAKEIYKMISVNAVRALYLNQSYGNLLSDEIENLLIIKKNKDNPFDNIIFTETEDIEFMMHKGRPMFGDSRFLDNFDLDMSDYYIFKIGNSEKFVFGHPERLIDKVDQMLGYHKKLPYIPFT